MTSLNNRECCRENFLFSNIEAWQLYLPQKRQSKCVSVFYIVWLWVWSLMFTTFLVLSGAMNQSWYTDNSERVRWFIYLTNWGYLLFCVGLLVRTITATYCYINQADRLTWYLKLNWILYEMSIAEAILIALLFWGLLYSEDYPMEVDTVINHGLNGVFVLVDLWVTALPIRVLHFYIPTLFGVAYISFSVIYDFSGGSNALGFPYIYSVLDWSESATWPAVYGVGSLVGILVLHLILFGLCKLRVYLYNKCLPSQLSSRVGTNQDYHNYSME